MEELNKNNPFKAPEGYFENFADDLFASLSKEKLDAPDPDSFPEMGFSVPKDYFDDLHKNITNKLDAKENKLIQLHPYRKYYVAAASIAAVALLVFNLNWNTSAELNFDALAHSEIESYFDDVDYEISSYEIAEMLPLEELEINDILEQQFDEENVIEYLSDTIDDFEEFNIVDYE